MQYIDDWEKLEYDLIPTDSLWNLESDVLKMHSIHSYPAKFPPFLASAAFKYAESEGVNVENVADIFCGCGTVALEAKVRGKNFWGCDINPVATLIAETKSKDYNLDFLKDKYDEIVCYAERKRELREDWYYKAHERLKYWFTDEQYNKLMCIYLSIVANTEPGEYRDAFFCIFSSMLKRTSRWLQKSIKPQIDPNKTIINPFSEFKHRFEMFYDAVKEMNGKKTDNMSRIEIVNRSLYQNYKKPKVDLIITSPPYVTSYEYADLHQLSLLWLNYCNDYKEMRRGTVGSSYNSSFDEEIPLNEVASGIVDQMKSAKLSQSKWKPVARYYRDMERAVQISKQMSRNNGMVIFVIGDSVIKGVKLDNSRHIIKAMLDAGLSDLKVSKRCISKGICVPYRDKTGKFTSNKDSSKEIYHEEYVISGRNYE